MVAGLVADVAAIALAVLRAPPPREVVVGDLVAAFGDLPLRRSLLGTPAAVTASTASATPPKFLREEISHLMSLISLRRVAVEVEDATAGAGAGSIAWL